MKRRPTFTAQQLIERGWTPDMIRALLGRHDRERPSQLQPEIGGQVLHPPVRLYLQERVERIEATEQFAQAQERARSAQDAAAQAADTRNTRVQAAIEATVAQYVPDVARPPDSGGWDRWKPMGFHRRHLWQHCYGRYQQWRVVNLPDVQLTQSQRRDLEQRLYSRLLSAFEAAYADELE